HQKTDVPKVKNSMYIITRRQGKLIDREISSIGKDLIPENYQEKVVENYKYIVDKFSSLENLGRLVVFTGPPGTGKTNLVKALCAELDSRIMYLDSSYIPHLTSPEFLEFFTDCRFQWGMKQEEPLYLILEDCDFALAKRDGRNDSIVGTFLNTCDGLIGDAMNLRFIATTNLEDNQMDEAIERPGRLLAKVPVGFLNKRRANQLLAKLKNCPI